MRLGRLTSIGYRETPIHERGRLLGLGDGMTVPINVPGEPPHLNRRELQCFTLAAAAKTNFEIAVILGISPETARRYGKRARAACDLVTCTQLLILGLRDDWHGFDETLDLRGLDLLGG